MPYSLSIAGNATYPEPEVFAKHIARADNVNNPDTRALSFLGIKAMNSNARLNGFMQVRTSALSAFSWSILPNTGADQAKADATTARVTNVVRSIIANHALAPVFGATVYELEWELDTNESRVSRMQHLKPTQVQVVGNNIDILKDQSKLEKATTLNRFSAEYLQQQQYLADSGNTSLVAGILRSILRLEIMRHIAMGDWADLNTLLKGILHVQDAGASDDDRVSAENAAQAAREGGWVSTSDMIKFNLFNAADAAGGTSLKDFVEYVDKSLAIAILGQANTTELPATGGSRAALQILKMISADIMWTDMQRIESVVNDFLVMDYIKNYNQSKPPYRFAFNDYEEQDYEQNVVVVREALNAGLELDATEVYNKIGFKQPEQGSNTIKREVLI